MKKRPLFLGVTALAAIFPVIALAAPLTIPNAFVDGDVIGADAFNENFDAIAAAFNDNDARIAELETAVADAVPAGTIAFFAAESCPAGWAEHADLRGRVPLGLPTSGTVSATVGSALLDEGVRTIAQVPAHTHAVGSLSATAGSAGVHNHATNSAGAHSHDLDLEAAGSYGTTHLMGTINGAGGDVSSLPVGSAGSHTHTISDAGSHTHSVTLSGSTATSGIAAVDVTMPYVQLLACAKS